MEKEKRILRAFCKKLIALDMDIFGLKDKKAMDAEGDKSGGKEKPEWITMNGAHIHVGKGETPKEAGQKFVAKKEAEKSTSQSKSTSSHKDFVKALNDNLSDEISKKNKEYEAEKDPQRKAFLKQDLDKAKEVLGHLWKNGGDPDNETMKSIWEKYEDYRESSAEVKNKLHPTEMKYVPQPKPKSTPRPGPSKPIEEATGGFWTKKEEMKADLEDAGYYVHDINGEYASVEDNNGREYKLDLVHGGNSMAVSKITQVTEGEEDEDE